MSYNIKDSLHDFMIFINNEKSIEKKCLMINCKKLLDKMNKQILRRNKNSRHIREVGDKNHRYRINVTSTIDSYEMLNI